MIDIGNGRTIQECSDGEPRIDIDLDLAVGKDGTAAEVTAWQVGVLALRSKLISAKDDDGKTLDDLLVMAIDNPEVTAIDADRYRASYRLRCIKVNRSDHGEL